MTAPSGPDTFQLYELQQEMDRFLVRFESWINHKKESMAKAKTKHHLKVLELQGTFVISDRDDLDRWYQVVAEPNSAVGHS
jgi:hypothetical protein